MPHATVAIDDRPDTSLIDRPALGAPSAPTPSTDERPACDEARLHHLFRHTLRAGQVNPLLHLLHAARRPDAQ